MIGVVNAAVNTRLVTIQALLTSPLDGRSFHIPLDDRFVFFLNEPGRQEEPEERGRSGCGRSRPQIDKVWRMRPNLVEPFNLVELAHRRVQPCIASTTWGTPWGQL